MGDPTDSVSEPDSLALKGPSPLASWLSRKAPLLGFKEAGQNEPVTELGAFVGLDRVVAVHEILGLPAESLAQSWTRTREYVESSLRLIDGDGGWLDKEEVEMILRNVGQPPAHCYPIYVFSVGSGKEERAVYVGKTSSTTARFAGGHSAAVRLHDPKYDGMLKRVYRGCVMFLTEEEYLPLEWISPLAAAEKLLACVEATLIFGLQPELNTLLRREFDHTISLTVQVENHCGTGFLNDDQFAYDRGMKDPG